MPPFERTVCGCADDVANCRRQPGPIGPGDLERIAAHLSEPVTSVLRWFKASPGAVVLDRRTGSMVRVGSITPRQNSDGSCIFLKNDRCQIHPVAPFGCAYFDVHMDAEEGNRRAMWLVQRHATPAFQALRALVDV